LHIRRIIVVPVIVFAAATTSVTLAGCVPSLGGGIDSLTSDQGELADVAVAVPAGWPSEVPLPPGQPLASGSAGTAMTYQTIVDDQQTAVAHVDAITAAGFEVISEQPTDTGGAWAFTNGTYRVTYQVNESDQGGGKRAAILQVDSEF
jgi:hypothetical protein